MLIKKKLRREKNKRWENIHERGGEEKELRREEKERKGSLSFLHKKKKWSVVKWGIQVFLLRYFTDGFTDEKLNINIFNLFVGDFICNI
jgi:hypothetical protein